VGHTQDDQAETILGRLLRGAGIRGLGGIEPRRVDGVIRPLLDCRRSEVRAYAVNRALPFVDDPSNHRPAFERVRIRHQVLPMLAAEDPRVIEHLCALSDEAAQLNAYLDAQLAGLPQPRAASSRPNPSSRFPHPFGFDGFEAGFRRKPD